MLLLGLWSLVMPVAAQTGSVTGQVVVEQAKVITMGPKSAKDVVVYLEPVAKQTYPVPEKRLEMDQRGLVFIPHVMSVQVGREVAFLNSDNDRHNVYFLFEKTGKTLDIGTWGPGQTVTHRFTEPGEVITLCQLHLEMAAYILVFDHPFHTTIELKPESQTAAYRLADVPPGDYLLKSWHKKLRQKGEPVRISVKPGETVSKNISITQRQYAKPK
jgi:plastocyanin